LSRRRINRDENSGLGNGKMTVREAGRRGGAKGGPRVRELVQKGKQYEEA